MVLTDFPYGIGVDYGTEFEDTPEQLNGRSLPCCPCAWRLRPSWH